MIKIKKIGNNTEALWNRPAAIGQATGLFKPATSDNLWPEFLNPSGAKYSRLDFKTMVERGIENRLLTSLAAAMPDGTIIAGSFMTSVMSNNTEAKDIDLFFTSPVSFGLAVNILLNPEDVDGFDFEKEEHWAVEGYKLDTASEKSFAENYGSPFVTKDTRFLKFVHPHRPPIQLIKLAWYDNAEHVIDSFDLTVSQFAYDCATDELVCNPMSIMDLMGKKLVLHRMQFPSSTLRRIIKYTHKGFYACPGSLARVAEEVAAKIEQEDREYVYID